MWLLNKFVIIFSFICLIWTLAWHCYFQHGHCGVLEGVRGPCSFCVCVLLEHLDWDSIYGINKCHFQPSFLKIPILLNNKTASIERIVWILKATTYSFSKKLPVILQWALLMFAISTIIWGVFLLSCLTDRWWKWRLVSLNYLFKNKGKKGQVKIVYCHFISIYCNCLKSKHSWKTHNETLEQIMWKKCSMASNACWRVTEEED